jgi:hypothetical protein
VPGNSQVRFDNKILILNNNHNNNNKNKETTNILSKKSTIGEGEYQIEDFKYLIGKEHIDPENGLLYVTVGIRKHGRIIAVDRRLAASPKGKLEAIHALDVASYQKPALAVSPLREATTAVSANESVRIGNFLRSRPLQEPTASPSSGLTHPHPVDNILIAHNRPHQDHKRL